MCSVRVCVCMCVYLCVCLYLYLWSTQISRCLSLPQKSHTAPLTVPHSLFSSLSFSLSPSLCLSSFSPSLYLAGVSSDD